jgi:hypothetical protein
MSRYYEYSERYPKDRRGYEYRVVLIPQKIKDTKRIYTEEEWRNLGIQQSPGWEHVLTWDDRKTMLFRRKVE